MSKFIKERFTGTEYVSYGDRFVARFKRGGRGPFLSFLAKNFTVEEYFALLDSGLAPLQALETRGYLQPHIKKMLRESGYPLTLAGRRQLIQDQIAAR